MIEIELPDGTILEAPDDADPSVVAKGYLASKGMLQGAPDKPAKNATLEAVKRGAGISVRDILQSIGSVGLSPADLGVALRNMITGSDYDLPSEMLSQSLDEIGLPKAESDSEKLISSVTKGAGTAASMVATGGLAGGTPAAEAVKSAVSSTPVMQVLSGGTGSGASEVARQSGAGPGGQLIAGIAGSTAPSLLRAGSAAATKAAFRGGASREQVAENIRSFDAAGTTPSVGQATESRVMRGAESLLSRAPGGAGVMAKTAQRQADDIGVSIEKQAAKLAPKSSAEQAGRAIEKGITGDGGFREAFKAKQSELYSKLDSQIPPSTRVSVENTRKALSSLNQEISGAPELSRFFKNGKMQEIESALAADIGGRDQVTNASQNALPYEALKKLRTLVGEEISDFSLNSSVPRSKWNALYSALSKDMESAAKASGEGATSAWQRANSYTRAGMRRMEVLDSVINKNGGPESVFKAATSGTREGASTLRAVMQSLPKDQQQMVTATVLRRLGRAKAGVQDDLGESFSTETFLTNWNSMAPEAKGVLFNRYGPDFRKDMDQVAKVAANLRAGSAVFKNPSGTAQAGIQYTTAGAFVMAVLSGNAPAAAAIAGGVGASNLASRLMVKPEFVKWLAKATKVPVNAVPALGVQLARSQDPELREFASLLEENGPDKKADDGDRGQQNQAAQY